MSAHLPAGSDVPTVAGAVAWLVVGAKHHASVYLDAARATQAAVEHHGVLLPLVLADELSEMLKAAFVQGQVAAAAAFNASHAGAVFRAAQPTPQDSEVRS